MESSLKEHLQPILMRKLLFDGNTEECSRKITIEYIKLVDTQDPLEMLSTAKNYPKEIQEFKDSISKTYTAIKSEELDRFQMQGKQLEIKSEKDDAQKRLKELRLVHQNWQILKLDLESGQSRSQLLKRKETMEKEMKELETYNQKLDMKLAEIKRATLDLIGCSNVYLDYA